MPMRLASTAEGRQSTMNYCVECGTRLEPKFLQNEGMIPFCPSCQAYRFPIFSTAVSMIVLNPSRDNVLLIQQYNRPYYILVAGYVNRGEDAEMTVRREVKEEIGLDVRTLCYNRSAYFAPSNTLMLNFTCVVSSDSLDGVTSEVDRAVWFPIQRARQEIKSGSLAQEFLEYFVQEKLPAL